ncbi:MAG: hypothetical protein E7812_02715 [Phenylobacterium sp.]|nr:MAG: hypothetical protein E7812_02715 [Phenylobacterium sp.]
MRLSAFVLRAALILAAASTLSGCLAATVAGAAVGVAGAAVGVAGSAVGETVHVGHMAVNAATGGGDKKSDAK